MKKSFADLLDNYEYCPLEIEGTQVVSNKRIKELTIKRIKELTMNTISVKPIGASIPATHKPRLRFPAAAAAAIICILTIGAATALALTNTWGIMDFLANRQQNAEVLPDAANIIQTEITQEGGEARLAAFSVREAIFDGLNVYIVVEVKPARQNYLLLGPDTMLSDTISEMGPLYGGMSGSVDEYVSKNDMIPIRTAISFMADSISIDFLREADGTLVYMLNSRYVYGDPQVTLDLNCITVQLVNGEHDMEDIQRETLTVTFQNSGALDSVTSVGTVDYADCGLRVEKVVLIRTPMETYAEIEYTVTDFDKFAEAGGDIRFEFIDENGERLAAGASIGDSGVTLISAGDNRAAPAISIRNLSKLPRRCRARLFYGLLIVRVKKDMGRTRLR